ncbi:hypothetical protein M407DRAFT_24992 [Tulasnella calospora MUT 4182]|uniref:Uncharacterized protein n=1 Tax=Tulasnella calospora MUT 4182 TaxID=1051891 RepID=A0A0C3LW42_9AGAM|nr:hypothetical protein M407DRAFT_24992 [Tulasnella calospora MUT 4182]
MDMLTEAGLWKALRIESQYEAVEKELHQFGFSWKRPFGCPVLRPQPRNDTETTRAVVSACHSRRTRILRSKHHYPVEYHTCSGNEARPNSPEVSSFCSNKTSESPGPTSSPTAAITSASDDQLSKTRDLELEPKDTKVRGGVFRYNMRKNSAQLVSSLRSTPNPQKS